MITEGKKVNNKFTSKNQKQEQLSIERQGVNSGFENVRFENTPVNAKDRDYEQFFKDIAEPPKIADTGIKVSFLLL